MSKPVKRGGVKKRKVSKTTKVHRAMSKATRESAATRVRRSVKYLKKQTVESHEASAKSTDTSSAHRIPRQHAKWHQEKLAIERSLMREKRDPTAKQIAKAVTKRNIKKAQTKTKQYIAKRKKAGKRT